MIVFVYCVETCSNRVWSRTVSRILSVSALACPFGVITGKCVQLNSISDLLDGYKKCYYTAAAVAAVVV